MTSVCTDSGLPFGIIDPDYASFFTVARIVTWSYGYALAMHGSFTRDLDLIAVPWIENAADPDHVLKNIEMRTCWKRQKEEGSDHPHGRKVWTLTSRKFECNRWVDFGFMPRLNTGAGQTRAEITEEFRYGIAKVVDARATLSTFLEDSETPDFGALAELDIAIRVLGADAGRKG